MSQRGNCWMCLLGSLLVCASVQAIESDSAANPYQGIVDRNVFGLKPPPPPASTAPETPPAPKVTLTGIATILGKKQVLMKVQMPAKPPEQAKEMPYTLTEGERNGEIEVLEIDVKTGTVKLNDYGTLLTLNLEKDGAKLPSTPAPPVAGMPGVPPPVGVVPNPFQPATGGAFQPPNPGMKSLPTRTLRLPTPSGGAAPGADASGLAPNAYAANGFSAPSYASATPGVMSYNPAVPGAPQQPGALKNYPPEVPMTPEEQAILIEAQREANRNNPSFPPLPPTVLSSTPAAQNPAGNNSGRVPVQIPPFPGRPQ